MKEKEDPKWEDAKKPCKCCPDRPWFEVSVCKVKAIQNNFELIQKMIRPANVRSREE